MGADVLPADIANSVDREDLSLRTPDDKLDSNHGLKLPQPFNNDPTPCLSNYCSQNFGSFRNLRLLTPSLGRLLHLASVCVYLGLPPLTSVFSVGLRLSPRASSMAKIISNVY